MRSTLIAGFLLLILAGCQRESGSTASKFGVQNRPSNSYSSAASAAPTGTSSDPCFTPSVAENGSAYGETSERTGLPKTVYVRGYYRRDGTYVRSHYRSHR